MKPAVSQDGASVWQSAYFEYRELERRFTDTEQHGFLFLLRAASEGRWIFDRRLEEVRAVCQGTNEGGLTEPTAALIEQMRTLADLRSTYDRESPGFVFENAYHLAFDRLRVWRSYGTPIPPASQCMRLYRGQRVDTWGVGGSIYRGLPEGSDRVRVLRERAAAVCQVARVIAARRGLSFADAMAVAQHYSAADILGVPTWLVDFSRDEWVALFFATDGGQTGDLGIVWDIMPTEYARHAMGDDNPIGPLQLVVPPNVLRIDNQAGVFVVAGLPQIFDQYVAFGWESRFKQHTGLRFEDPALGVTAQRIYPPDDPLWKVLADVPATAVDCGCEAAEESCRVPPAVFTDPFDPITYERLLICWLEEAQAERSGHSELPGARIVLAGIARFHARLHFAAYADRLPSLVSRSLNRLRDAFEVLYFAMLEGRTVSVRNAVAGSYLRQMQGRPEHAVLLEALNESESGEPAGPPP
jgi:hypothetical protein